MAVGSMPQVGEESSEGRLVTNHLRANYTSVTYMYHSPTPSWSLSDSFCFSNVSEHADGERRGPVSISRCLAMRLAETFPTLPSDFDPALGVRHRHAPKSC